MIQGLFIDFQYFSAGIGLTSPNTNAAGTHESRRQTSGCRRSVAGFDQHRVGG
jgi:hypothetical protein